MEAVLKDSKGNAYALNWLLDWELTHSCGEGSDAFSLRTVMDGSLLPVLEKAVYFEATHNGERVFTGLVDEFELAAAEDGMTAMICGRGMGARLLDNQAVPGQIAAATPRYILESQVQPFGVMAGTAPEEAGRSTTLTIYSGESRWSVVKRFSESYYGARPRFDRFGRLHLDGSGGEYRVFTDRLPLTELRYIQRRYGVISEVLVRSNTLGREITVENEAFRADGGSAGRVLSMPNRTTAAQMREAGEKRLAESLRGTKSLTLRVPALFAAFAGDTVHLGWTVLGVGGEFTVEESRSICGGGRAETVLTLYKKED